MPSFQVGRASSNLVIRTISKMYNQVKLTQDLKVLVCWIPVDKRVKTGVRLTLKGLDGWWSVKEIYSKKLNRKPHQDWKVGGLV